MDDRGSTFAGGARAGVPVVLGYLSIGFAAGVVERTAGLSVAEVMLLTLLLYAGAAQFVVASLVAAAAAPSTAIITVSLVNLRNLLLSAALAPHARRFAAWEQVAVGSQLTDETFVVAWNRLAGGSALDPRWMIGLNLVAYLAWALANLAGALLAGKVGDTRALGFDFALPAMFGALLVLQLFVLENLRRAIAVALLGAVVAIGAALALPDNWNIIVATIVGATAGLALERWTSDTPSF